MLKTIKIDKIYRNTTKQDGSQYIDKRGKKFILVVIATQGQSGEIKASYCDYDGKTAEWQAGDVVQVNIEKNGQYINFSPPSKLDLLEKRIEAIEATLNSLTKVPHGVVASPQTHKTPSSDELPLSNSKTSKDEDSEFGDDLPF